jgi:hypothetical protein
MPEELKGNPTSPKVVPPELSPAKAPVIPVKSEKGFKCARCGNTGKTTRKGVEVCDSCFAPTFWKA